MARRHAVFAAVLSLFLLNAGCDAGKAPTTPSGDGGRIVVLGDSLAVSPSPARAFPAVLQQKLNAAGLPWTVLNRSGSGDTSAGGRARLDAAFDERPDILILELGANDGLQGIAIATIRANLTDIIVRTKARGVEVLLCGMETFPTRGLQYARDFHDIFPSLAQEHDIPLVPFLLRGVIGNPDLNLDDLIHPNAAGAERIAANVWPFLQRLLGSGLPRSDRRSGVSGSGSRSGGRVAEVVPKFAPQLYSMRTTGVAAGSCAAIWRSTMS